MASISKLSIRGVRSFSPSDEEQVIGFCFPLTIIVGGELLDSELYFYFSCDVFMVAFAVSLLEWDQWIPQLILHLMRVMYCLE